MHRAETRFEEVQNGGFFCLCFDCISNIVLLPGFGNSLLNHIFFPHYKPALSVPSGMNSRSVYLTSV